jgi:hypothetical protein
MVVVIRKATETMCSVLLLLLLSETKKTLQARHSTECTIFEAVVEGKVLKESRVSSS